MDIAGRRVARSIAEPATMSEAVAALAPVLEAKPVEVGIEGTAAPARGDAASLRQVVTNLIANAVKFSSPGARIEVTAWERDGTARLTVTDHGAGIDAALLPHIFERFVRADPARSSEGGSGLGLAICREIIAAHGGRITAESRTGDGSTFSIELPSRATP